MDWLNKKLSEKTERKVDQLETSTLRYLLSLCFILASAKALIDLDPYQTTVASITLFWLALSIDGSKRIYIYLSSIILSAYLLNYKAFLLGSTFAVFLIGSGRAIQHYKYEEDISLLLSGVLSHLGDLYTTFLGLQSGFSEQNPFLQHLGDSNDISSGLFISKTTLFLIIGYLYRIDFEDLNSILKILVSSGFFLTLTNLNIILSGI